ncbi:MAG: hypothetical protein JSS32_05615 [Verrucomicrobia bacterium]|nr:hypothetical protein [Verrucomicrobiota bacterium]
MLEGLFGNKNIQKVLLFLFVNGKGYGTQLHRSLRTPLTSLQNALTRLEKGRIIASYLEGKTKLYQLNPSYPLLPELEQLLKKAFTLLTPHEKKLFSLVQLEASEKRVQEPLLLNFWERLKTVRRLGLHTKSHGKGHGDVIVAFEGSNKLVFHEKGSWHNKMDFSNVFRWTLDRSAGAISLEHLRFGPNAPVFLFHLAPTGSNLLASVESHLCEHDAYLAQVVWDKASIRLTWRVIGPRKNEEWEYHYF